LPSTRTSYSKSTIRRGRKFTTVKISLPEGDKRRRPKLPINKIPSCLDEFTQPSFTPEEIDNLAYWDILRARPDIVLRLAIATIYGIRVGELAQLSYQHINLDHEGSTILIPTEKKGRRVPQPIPTELIPLFSIPLKPTNSYLRQRHLKRLYKKVGALTPHRTGIHSIRRSVITILYSHTDLKELGTRRFLR
jgi:integrase